MSAAVGSILPTMRITPMRLMRIPQPVCSGSDVCSACRLEKARDAAFAREGVERLIGVFAVAPVDDNVIRRASASCDGLA